MLAASFLLWYHSIMKTIRHTIHFLTAVCVIFSMLCGCNNAEAPVPSLTLTVFACGKADAMLLQFDDYTVMIDTGENGDGDELVESLSLAGVKNIDLMILTHHDKDHIGGADAILNHFPTATVRMPSYETNTKQYLELIDALEESETEIVRMNKDAVFSLGSADFVMWVSPLEYNGKDGDDNEQSLVTKFIYQGKSFLFTGDAEKEWLKNLCFSSRNLTCDVLKLPHHGVYDKNIPTLLALTLPDYVLITDSAKNPADSKTIDILKTLGQHVFRTENGTIRMTLTNGTFSVVQY